MNIPLAFIKLSSIRYYSSIINEYSIIKADWSNVKQYFVIPTIFTICLSIFHIVFNKKMKLSLLIILL